MANRWFLVPAIAASKPNPGDRPKYADESGIDGWAGQQVTVNGTTYYAARFRGTTAALDTVESYSDATSIQESSYTKLDIASYLNQQTGHAYSFAEWEERFLSS